MLLSTPRIALLTLSLIPFSLGHAQEGSDPNDNSGFYIGVKGGPLIIDLPHYQDDDGLGFVAGYDFGGFGIEFEHTETEGNFSVSNLGFGYVRGDYELKTNALYGVYRSQGTGYFKVKLGILNEDISVSAGGVRASDDDTGASAGIGAGVRVESFALEVEYTVIEEDVGFLSLGLNYTF